MPGSKLASAGSHAYYTYPLLLAFYSPVGCIVSVHSVVHGVHVGVFVLDGVLGLVLGVVLGTVSLVLVSCILVRNLCFVRGVVWRWFLFVFLVFFCNVHVSVSGDAPVLPGEV